MREGDGARPFLTDTCTLYKSTRHNAVDHLETAYRHGFTPYVVDAPVIMADGVTQQVLRGSGRQPETFRFGQDCAGVSFRQRDGRSVPLQGHAMGGFGGAIKNLAMGCAPQAGKIDQHGRNVVIYPKCIGCGQCVPLCPRNALSLEKGEKGRHAVIDKERCIGCYECVTACKQGAIGVDTPNEYSDFAERMAEYAYGAVKGKEGRICYLNFLLNVTPPVRLRRMVRAGDCPGSGYPRFGGPRSAGHGLFRSGEGSAQPHSAGRARRALLRLRQVLGAASEYAGLASG